MIDKSKLHNIFEAALRDPSPVTAPVTLKPIYPTSSAPEFANPVQAPQTFQVPQAFQSGPIPQVIQQVPVVATPTFTPEPGVPTQAADPQTSSTAVLDDAASNELAALLDEQMKRKKRKQRIATLTTVCTMLAITGGTAGWFVQSPDRVTALKEAIQDIRSVGDVKSIVAKFQASLDRVAARSHQIDAATAAMGVTANASDEEDPYFDTEMKDMMGGEGKTVGQRNRQLKDAFAERAEDAGGVVKTKAELKPHESFEWGEVP